MAEENRLNLKAVSGVCLTFGVQNLNPQQEKALTEFLSGSDVFVNYDVCRVFNDHSHA